jgi:hypothetical protein
MPHRKKLNILNNPPALDAPPTLWLRNSARGVFEVRVAGRDEHWTPSQLHDFLVAQGYTAQDAEACVAQAEIASEIQISLPVH